jgi:phosphoserine phosphatase RsbU/P
MPARSIACMEVWGGSHAFSSAVRVPGNNVHVSCTPFEHGETGGDIYYVSNCAAGLITRFVLADVAGHGEAVAHIARDLRRIMRRHINTANQTRFALELNAAFAALELNGRFATAVLATYFAPTDHLIVCNAGHPRPLIYHARTGEWGWLDSRETGVLVTRQDPAGPTGISNLPLGILDPTDYEQFAIHLDPGDLVVLYTDALIEAADASGRQLGEEGLLALAGSVPRSEHAQLPDAIRQGISAHTGGRRLEDDASLIVLQHTGEDPPAPPGHIARVARMLGLGAIDSGPGLDS